MTLTVRHLDGPFKGQTQTFNNDVESILIGRDPATCQIVLPPDAGMTSLEHCTLARVRGRYIINMNANCRVAVDDGQLLERGTPLDDSCKLQIGPDGPWLKLLATQHSKMMSTGDQQIDKDEVSRRAARSAAELDAEFVAAQARNSRRIATIAGVIAVLAFLIGGIVLFVMQYSAKKL